MNYWGRTKRLFLAFSLMIVFWIWGFLSIFASTRRVICRQFAAFSAGFVGCRLWNTRESFIQPNMLYISNILIRFIIFKIGKMRRSLMRIGEFIRIKFEFLEMRCKRSCRIWSEWGVYILRVMVAGCGIDGCEVIRIMS